MSSMLCWFWCCVKACPGSCRKHPDLWCFEFHWWKPAGCVMSRPTPSPRGMLSGILSLLSPVLLYHKNLITMLIRSQTRFQKQYIGCEFQGFPQPGFDVCGAVVRFSVRLSTCWSWGVLNAKQALSSYQPPLLTWGILQKHHVLDQCPCREILGINRAW